LIGISTIPGTLAFFSVPQLVDHLFALGMTGLVTLVGIGVVKLFAKLRGVVEVDHFIPKAVGTSCVILMPTMFVFSQLFTVT
jgi:hypothetical protein